MSLKAANAALESIREHLAGEAAAMGHRRTGLREGSAPVGAIVSLNGKNWTVQDVDGHDVYLYGVSGQTLKVDDRRVELKIVRMPKKAESLDLQRANAVLESVKRKLAESVRSGEEIAPGIKYITRDEGGLWLEVDGTEYVAYNVNRPNEILWPTGGGHYQQKHVDAELKARLNQGVEYLKSHGQQTKPMRLPG